MTNYKFGWKPQKPDHRDLKFSIRKLAPVQSVYLSDKYNVGAMFDQGNLGSCVGNGVGYLLYFNLLNKNVQKVVSPFRFSRLFIYYFGRLLENTVSVDSGLEVRDAIKVVADKGAPSEDVWPYDISKFAVQPSDQAVNSALSFQSLEYRSVDNTQKQLLISALLQGLPVVFGMTVFESFMSDQVAASGIVPSPGPNERVEGGHCMVIVGYHAIDDSFIVRNSWGLNWGQQGYCRIPASYICDTDFATDFWVISKIE